MDTSHAFTPDAFAQPPPRHLRRALVLVGLLASAAAVVGPLYWGMWIGLPLIPQLVHFWWNIFSDQRRKQQILKKLKQQGLSEKELKSVNSAVSKLPDMAPIVLKEIDRLNKDEIMPVIECMAAFADSVTWKEKVRFLALFVVGLVTIGPIVILAVFRLGDFGQFAFLGLAVALPVWIARRHRRAKLK
jgi:hypothetical protein